MGAHQTCHYTVTFFKPEIQRYSSDMSFVNAFEKGAWTSGKRHGW